MNVYFLILQFAIMIPLTANVVFSHEKSARPCAVFLTENPIYRALWLGGKNEDFIRRAYLVAGFVDASRGFQERLFEGYHWVQSHLGSRLLAEAVLREGSFSALVTSDSVSIESIQDREPRKFEHQQSMMNAVLRSAEQNQEFIVRTQVLDRIFSKLFASQPQLYQEFGHSPFLLPYVYYRYYRPPSAMKRLFARFSTEVQALRQALEGVIARFKLTPMNQLDYFLAQRTRDPEVQSLLEFYEKFSGHRHPDLRDRDFMALELDERTIRLAQHYIFW